MSDQENVLTEIQEKMQRPDLRASDFKKDEKGRFIFPLQYPFHFGSEEITELRLRKPKTKHIKKLSSTPKMGELIRVVEVISDQPTPLIDEVDPADTLTAVEFLGKFF